MSLEHYLMPLISGSINCNKFKNKTYHPLQLPYHGASLNEISVFHLDAEGIFTK